MEAQHNKPNTKAVLIVLIDMTVHCLMLLAGSYFILFTLYFFTLPTNIELFASCLVNGVGSIIWWYLDSIWYFQVGTPTALFWSFACAAAQWGLVWIALAIGVKFTRDPPWILVLGVCLTVSLICYMLGVFCDLRGPWASYIAVEYPATG